jgi:hypothetical protein
MDFWDVFAILFLAAVSWRWTSLPLSICADAHRLHMQALRLRDGAGVGNEDGKAGFGLSSHAWPVDLKGAFLLPTFVVAGLGTYDIFRAADSKG